MKIIHNVICLAAACSLLSSCSEKGWGVEGKVVNAPEGAKVAVEGFNAGMWYNIDSVKVSSDGSFAYRSPSGSPYPDIYRVSLDGKSIYFPIDSLETVTVTTDATDFDNGYTLAGSQMAETMMNVDARIAGVVAQKGAVAAATDSLLKRELSQLINDDESGILGYYIVNKTVGDVPLFSTGNRADLRVIGALANKFLNNMPDDPRTQYLCAQFLMARRDLNPGEQQGVQFVANETGLVDIDLYDPKGQKRKLSDVAANSGITLLSFTSYQIEPSLAYNAELKRMKDLFAGSNLNIYQVSLDADEVQWRTVASNLPWTAVWYDSKDGGALINMYNVGALPMTYIIDRNGDLVERVVNPADLEKSIRKHL